MFIVLLLNLSERFREIANFVDVVVVLFLTKKFIRAVRDEFGSQIS